MWKIFSLGYSHHLYTYIQENPKPQFLPCVPHSLYISTLTALPEYVDLTIVPCKSQPVDSDATG